MGQVVPFIARVRDSGDWTAGERSRLEALADQLAARGVKVEVVFGATDAGDPWCVVTDGDGDVLIHVARIDGKFVVHSAADDTVSEASDLHAALRDRLSETEAFAAPKSAVVLPFGLTARQGQTFLALVAATAFFYETSGSADTAQAAELLHVAPAHDDPPPPPAPETDAPAHDRQLATQGAALQGAEEGSGSKLLAPVAETTAPTPTPAPEPHQAPPPPAPLEPAPQAAHAAPVPAAQPPEPPPLVIRGTSGDDSLSGTAANEHILGGAGNDTLQGGGGHDTLDGGAGDDRIELGKDVVAIGGQGADTFVVQPPHQMGHADTLLGTILDYSGAEGDRVLTWRGDLIKLPPQPLNDAKTGSPTTQEFAPTTSQAHTVGPAAQVPANLTRVELDLNGDGVADGYVLMGAHGHASGGSDPITVTGKSLTPDDPLG